MDILKRVLKGLGRISAYVLSAAILLAIALVLVIGFAPAATRLAVDTVARMASTPDRIIAISEPSGLLSGAAARRRNHAFRQQGRIPRIA